MDRIVIAGGSGLVGAALVESLARDGREVTVLSRRPGAVGVLPGGARVVGWDGRTAGAWTREVEGAAAVVNLCGESVAGRRWSAARKRRLHSSRLEPTRALVEAIEQSAARPEALLQASAIGIYGSLGTDAVDETANAGGGFLADLGREWEAASAPVEALGVRRVVLRTGIVLARSGGALPRMLRPFRIGLGGRLGDGRQGFSWIHLEDEVRSLRFLTEHQESSGPFNLTAPRPVSNRELSAALGRALHRPVLLPVPPIALRALFGELAEILLSGQFVQPARLVRAGFRFRYETIDEALVDLLARQR
jgi:uncharacterized protein (TIGR01777 family)